MNIQIQHNIKRGESYWKLGIFWKENIALDGTEALAFGTWTPEHGVLKEDTISLGFLKLIGDTALFSLLLYPWKSDPIYIICIN